MKSLGALMRRYSIEDPLLFSFVSPSASQAQNPNFQKPKILDRPDHLIAEFPTPKAYSLNPGVTSPLLAQGRPFGCGAPEISVGSWVP